MKKSELVNKIANLLMDGYAEEHQTHDTGVFCLDQAERIVVMAEEAGMLPPTNTCKLVPDHLRGGMKHSETKREWDEE